MHILGSDHHDSVRPLFAGLDDQLAVAAILAGEAPGRVYVDDLLNPAAAFTWTGHRLFLAGSPERGSFNDEVRRLLGETICPQARALGLAVLVLAHTPEAWADVIPDAILPGKNPIRARRHTYEFRAKRCAGRRR